MTVTISFFFSEDLKKVYLIFYNLFMYVGFLYICIVVGALYLKEGIDCYPNIYPAVGQVMVCLFLLQYLEGMHCMFGYTTGSTVVAFVQAFGRSVFLLAFIEAEPRMQTKPIVFYLTLTWSLIEIVR